MDWVAVLRVDRPELVDRLSDDVHDTTKRHWPHWNSDWTLGVDGFHPADQAFGRFHGDAPAAAFTEMLLHLNSDSYRLRDLKAVTNDDQSLINRRQLDLFELDVDNGPDYL